MTALPPQAPDNAAALLELCDAQHDVIERLQHALAEHEQIEADQHLLKRMLAHELRTPLAAVIGTLHTLGLPNLPVDKQAQLRVTALKQAEQLNEMIEDILALSDPHEASVERTPQESVHVAELVSDVIDQVSGSVDPARIVLDLDEDLAIRTIPGRVRQVLVNLLVNAAKYSPADGSVSLIVTRLDDRVVFEVLDEGPGIPPGKVEAMFEPFRRGARESTEGVGLGLYLVRNLVRSLGGTVQLLPRSVGGTVARVELPQKRLEDTTAPRRRPTHLEVATDR